MFWLSWIRGSGNTFIIWIVLCWNCSSMFAANQWFAICRGESQFNHHRKKIFFFREWAQRRRALWWKNVNEDSCCTTWEWFFCLQSFVKVFIETIRSSFKESKAKESHSARDKKYPQCKLSECSEFDEQSSFQQRFKVYWCSLCRRCNERNSRQYQFKFTSCQI